MKPMKYNTPKQRLKIYEKCLEITKKGNWEDISGINKGGLCFLLSSLISGQQFMHEESPTAREAADNFPEFLEHHDSFRPKTRPKSYYRNRKQWRIKVLTEIIKNLKSK